jgi:spore germination cell wall hydrolase CwlJ-like protein
MVKLIAHMVLAVTAGMAGCAVAPDIPAQKMKHQQECMALAMYWEAGGEGPRGMTAVGWTILNRVESPDFPSTPCDVVYQGGELPGCQFSFYCDGRSDRPRNWRSWQQAMLIAGDLLARSGRDPTHGALFFHSTGIASAWHRQRPRTARIGGHVFYR